MPPENRLSFAVEIAEEAGRLACSMRSSPEGLETQSKGPLDIVTQADLACEKLIRSRIAAAYPDEGVLGEEAGLDLGSSGVWIVDPIDGTTNFARGMREWAVSIAFYDGEELTLGVIHAPDLGLTAAANAGSKASLNGAGIAVQNGQAGQNPIVSLGYSLRTPIETYLDRISSLMAAGIEHRRHGAATIGFLGVLAGWVDGYYEEALNIWDAAAGLVLVNSAGGRTAHAPIKEFLTTPSAVFADNGQIENLPALIEAQTAGVRQNR